MKLKFKIKNKYSIILFLLSILCFLFSFNKTTYANEIENKDSSTIVDVSNISIGENVVHNHVYESKTNENFHWIECLICHNIVDKDAHSFTYKWALGEESCTQQNSATRVCHCGYSDTYHKPCVWKGEYMKNEKWHRKKCDVCKIGIIYSYYDNEYGKGELHTGDTLVNCTDVSGNLISCENGGTCVVCKKTYSKGHSFTTDRYKYQYKITCGFCKKNFGSFSIEKDELSNTTPTTRTIQIELSLSNGATFEKATKMQDPYGTYYSSNTSSCTTNNAKTISNVTYVVTHSNTLKTPFNSNPEFYISINGISHKVVTGLYCLPKKPVELNKPTITSITTNDVDISQNDWITSKEIIVKGKEDYSNTVNISIKNENNIEVYKGMSNVQNGNYSFQFVPKIEANEIEKTYIITITDANGNFTTQNLVIKKVDTKEPTFFINNDKLFFDTNTNTIKENIDWSNSKFLDLYFKDEGIGNVSIGINNYDDILPATYDETIGAYKRSYTFTGDAYEPINCVIYAKDGLGNLSTTTFVLDKIDNTKPTIEKLDKTIDVVEVLSANSEEENITSLVEPTTTSYAKVTIMANDINERLGLEGSGVTQYGIKSSNSNEIVWYDTNEIEINENGTYYIYVKDLVGNISSPMILVINELEEEVNNKVNVYVTQASTFSVKIPKVMILSGQTKQGEYKVIVEGNIGGMDSVSVKPDTILLLTQLGKDDILANVTQDKTTFSYDDFANTNEIVGANGLVDAPSMTAGSWKGTFFFDIKFSVVTKDSSIGSIKEDANALEENVIGKDTIQDKHTQYKYGFELNN